MDNYFSGGEGEGDDAFDAGGEGDGGKYCYDYAPSIDLTYSIGGD